MPIEIIYFLIVTAVVLVGFLLLKRPIYETMMVALIVLFTMTGMWGSAWDYMYSAMKSSTLFSIIAFLAATSILGKTGVIDDIINIILALFGRLTGGAGYVAVIASTFMGALSGSGPGNVATTGVFTIPAMKRTGFPAHLAAGIEMASSLLGNIIPPSSMIVMAFAVLDTLYPETYTMSQFWLFMWVFSLWFVLQRIVVLYVMCKVYKVKPMPKEEIPSLKETLKKGWKSIFLPIIVVLPFLIDSVFESFLDARLGAGAGSFSSSIIVFVPSLLIGYALLIAENKNDLKLFNIVDSVKGSMKTVVPTCAVVVFSYVIGNVFKDVGFAEVVGGILATFNMNYYVLCIVIPLLITLMSMILPGSAQVPLFGPVIITLMMSAGGTSPMMLAALLPCICGVMHGMTPPVATAMYVAMGIAGSGFKETTKQAIIWVICHFILAVLLAMGFIPMFGLAV